MYRFHFDVSTNQWLIQFLKLGFFWMSIQDQSFDTIEDAEAYAKTKGLDKIYLMQDTPRGYANAHILFGQGSR